MPWFNRPRTYRFPDDMLDRLDMLGRFTLGKQASGIDSSDVWSRCLGPFLHDAQADPDTFFTALHDLVRGDDRGFPAFGAAHMAWELIGGDSLTTPAAIPLIDAGIDFKLARGLTDFHLTGYEKQRLNQRQAQN